MLAAPEHVELEPSSGVTSIALAGAHAVAEVAVRGVRWGVRPIGPATVVAAGGAFGAFRFVAPVADAAQLTTLPVPSSFDSAAPLSHPRRPRRRAPVRTTG